MGGASAVGGDRRVRRAWSRARAHVAGAPATFTYLAVVTGTAVALAATRADVDAVLRGRSSNLAALADSPPQGLIQSAFFVDGWPMLAVAAALAVALAPAERWLGTPRWLAVFLLGHVVTSLAVAGAVWVAIAAGDASPGLRRMVDVGVSYGFAAVAGVLAYRLARRWALAYAAAGLAVLALVLGVHRTFTDLGHLLAFAVGLACLPLVPGERRFRRPVVVPAFVRRLT
jgi:Rhomboid-like protein